jgi:transcriptional regulatory protein GAL4
MNTVRALGAFSGDACHQNADIYFYQEASKSLTWDKLQRGTLSLVQAFALLANYLQKRNRPNSGFTLLGIAMNMAQGVGLHREFLGPAVSTFTMEIRRRVWWTLFIFDSAFRLTFGRPTLSLGGINTQLPRNIDDKDLAVDLDELPPPREVPTVTSCLIWQAKLARIGNMANEKLVAKHIPDQSRMLALGEQVVQWYTSLPNYMHANDDVPEFEVFSIPRMVLLWRSMHLRIIIYRPYLLDHVRQRISLNFNDSNAPASCCFFAAEECVLSLLNFFSRTISLHGSLTWYASYWLVTAVFVHVTCLLYEPQHASALDWRQKIEDSKSILERIGPFEPTASRAARILDKVMGETSFPLAHIFCINFFTSHADK